MREIHTDDAPSAIGPFSQAMQDGDRIYVSGQGPVDPESGEVVSEDIKEQTAQTLENLETILEAADASLDDVLKTNVYVTNMDNYDAVNEVYAEYMSEPYPARAAMEVSRLPIDIGVEIELVARSE
ncbi:MULTISPECIES: Rid family detoxifying hydrolase [Halomicrobium]|uniref:RidA family protein n=1 Tax=Halomicrobium mukohataei TaxID=57705 RepID=A0A847UA58_9EURY|nr:MULTISPECIES: Rid family detoxifying hydrolase [Halomicrobium]MBO4247651.1 RidA family protein [Halomicrobium sp. IBSBa]NLV09127.1 RidA family protein [Halomicrobium mukohataei]QGA81114.1 Translation initiation inhibitor, yjgF family [Halomicrobium sp. LC1Hm]